MKNVDLDYKKFSNFNRRLKLEEFARHIFQLLGIEVNSIVEIRLLNDGSVQIVKNSTEIH
jgi:hypothetical protein